MKDLIADYSIKELVTLTIYKYVKLVFKNYKDQQLKFNTSITVQEIRKLAFYGDLDPKIANQIAELNLPFRILDFLNEVIKSTELKDGSMTLVLILSNIFCL